MLLAEVERNPEDERSAFYLAQTYFNLGDFASAIEWFKRRVEMGGWDEETYYAKYQMAEAMAPPGCAVGGRAGRLSAGLGVSADPRRAAAGDRVPVPHRSALPAGPPVRRACRVHPVARRGRLFVGADVYAWRAVDEQAVCASWIGQHTESFTLCRQLLARSDIPDDDRKRIAGNRDISAPAMIDAALSYPDVLAQQPDRGVRDAEVTVTWSPGGIARPPSGRCNSFLNSCLDVSRVGRFIVVNAGLSAEDRATAGRAISVPRVRPACSRRWVRRPTRDDPRRDRRTILAPSGPQLAVFRARPSHRPPVRGARGRTSRVPGRDQLR